MERKGFKWSGGKVTLRRGGGGRFGEGGVEVGADCNWGISVKASGYIGITQ